MPSETFTYQPLEGIMLDQSKEVFIFVRVYSLHHTHVSQDKNSSHCSDI